MPRALLIGFSILIVIALVVFSSTYTVRFTESAVVTRFGKANEDSVVRDAGLKWKLPAPFSSVTKYDTRARFIEPGAETFSTADQTQLVVQGFLTWRVDDPLQFYKRHRGTAGSSVSEHYRVAENNLRSIFRSALSEISGFTRDELFNPNDSKLEELEDAIKRRMTDPSDEEVDGVGEYGIAIDLVGITSIEMPQAVTEQVFKLMQSEQRTKAASTESEGQAEAAKIRAEGNTAAERILAFARLRAAELQNRGELEAARFIQTQATEPKLAEFLQRVELLKEGLGRQTTLILPTSFYGVELFDPEWIEQFAPANDRSEVFQP